MRLRQPEAGAATGRTRNEEFRGDIAKGELAIADGSARSSEGTTASRGTAVRPQLGAECMAQCGIALTAMGQAVPRQHHGTPTAAPATKGSSSNRTKVMARRFRTCY